MRWFGWFGWLVALIPVQYATHFDQHHLLINYTVTTGPSWVVTRGTLSGALYQHKNQPSIDTELVHLTGPASPFAREPKRVYWDFALVVSGRVKGHDGGGVSDRYLNFEVEHYDEGYCPLALAETPPLLLKLSLWLWLLVGPWCLVCRSNGASRR